MKDIPSRVPTFEATARMYEVGVGTTLQNKVLDTVFLNGCWQSFTSARKIELVNPDTERQIGTLLCADANITGQTVKAAVQAFPAWSTSTLHDRILILEKMIALLEAKSGDFARTISLEIGAPIDFALSAQVKASIEHLRGYCVALGEATSSFNLEGNPEHQVRYEPIGVAALITPWNWPLNQVVLKVGAALAAGCTIVLKPSEYGTQTAVAFTSLMAEVGLADGVFNLLIGDAHTGEHLVKHDDVALISFTGSSQIGQRINFIASERFARTAMELGGKSANLIFSDCDIDRAVYQGLAHCFRNTGQSCNAASRMIVDRAVYDRVVDLAAKEAASFRVGRPFEPGPNIGPLVNAKQFARVRSFLELGISSGARLVAGGLSRPANTGHGFYVQPTVFADVYPDNALFHEEIFGPVLCITPFDDEEEAISLANATRYGLAAYIQTNDGAKAERVASKLHAGMIQINGTSRVPGAPFGGVKASGHGREGGIWGIRSFQEIKSISGLHF